MCGSRALPAARTSLARCAETVRADGRAAQPAPQAQAVVQTHLEEQTAGSAAIQNAAAVSRAPATAVQSLGGAEEGVAGVAEPVEASAPPSSDIGETPSETAAPEDAGLAAEVPTASALKAPASTLVPADPETAHTAPEASSKPDEATATGTVLHTAAPEEPLHVPVAPAVAKLAPRSSARSPASSSSRSSSSSSRAAGRRARARARRRRASRSRSRSHRRHRRSTSRSRSASSRSSSSRSRDRRRSRSRSRSRTGGDRRRRRRSSSSASRTPPRGPPQRNLLTVVLKAGGFAEDKPRAREKATVPAAVPDSKPQAPTAPTTESVYVPSRAVGNAETGTAAAAAAAAAAVVAAATAVPGRSDVQNAEKPGPPAVHSDVTEGAKKAPLPDSIPAVARTDAVDWMLPQTRSRIGFQVAQTKRRPLIRFRNDHTSGDNAKSVEKTSTHPDDVAGARTAADTSDIAAQAETVRVGSDELA
jgi:hypothetical protein